MKRKKIDIFFILFDIGFTLENSSVFQSQVGNKMIFLKSLGYKVGILTLYENKLKFDKKIGAKLKSNGIKLFLIKKSFFIIDLIKIIFYSNILLFKFKVKNYYCRSFWGALIINFSNPFFKNKYTYDIRGDTLDEYKSINMNRLKKNIYFLLEKWGIKSASNLTSVSNTLSMLVKKRFNVKKVYTIPCCVNFKDFEIKKKYISEIKRHLNFNKNDIIFVYSGGLSYYQQIPKMLELWKKFIKYDFIKFLLLTNDDPHSNPITINKLKIFGKKLIHMNVSFSDIPKYLNSSNVGFMLRESRGLNSAASPVKFSEYLASNLKIVASPGIGDISSYIVKNKTGILVDINNLDKGEKDLKKLVFEISKNNFKREKNIIESNCYDWSFYGFLFKKIYS